ncbi:MAG: hypothetical protein JXR60_05470 [Bacteroidales bacterium]|nr:hypothetical protein [Bacteroidales bacterium]
MKKFRIVSLLLLVVVMSTVLEGCFRKGEEDPFVSLKSRKARITNTWDFSTFTGDYLLKLNSGENRYITLFQESESKISETTQYVNMTDATRDSLQAGQDTTITWDGKIIEAYYEIKDDGTFEFAYEYVLEKTHGKYYENGTSQSINSFWPAFPGKPFRVDSTMSRNYRTEYRGRWNFLDKYDGYKKRERVVFEIENATYITNYSTYYVFDAEDDDGVWPGDPVDTTYSHQSLESINHKYANGEYSIIWELDKLKGKEMKLYRELDHIYTHALTGYEGYKSTRKGNETVELIEHVEQ